jgi:hypothetical protein
LTGQEAAGSPSVAPSLLGAFTSLPGVSQLLQAITTYDIGPVTELLDRSAYFPLLVSIGAARGDLTAPQVGAGRRFELATETAAPAGRIVGRNRLGGPAAFVRCRWRVIPDDYVGSAGKVLPVPVIPLVPRLRQRVEVYDWVLRFGSGVSGYRAYGTGHTLPDENAGGGPTAAVGFVLDVVEGFGQLAGLAGTVVASGTAAASGELELLTMTRIVDPAGGLIARLPILPPPPGAGPPLGVTYLTFLGQVDPAHPTTLRVSLTEGFLGSNVAELLQTATLDFEDGGAASAGGAVGGLRSSAVRTGLVGSLVARLSFDPVTLCAISPIQTRLGVFEFRDQAGRSLGSLRSNMTEGRAFRTSLPGKLIPVYRFAGFGPILGGTGEFAGARGILVMNSVISVQPRTLSNLYVLRLLDPDGRYRAAAGVPAGAAPAAGDAGRSAR